MRTNPIGLYLHIPFCIKKCSYCDFCSYPGLDEQTRKKYISQLINEICSYKREEKIAVDTIFFGGGTPSLLEPSEFSLICDAIEETFLVSSDTEFSIEANPKTITREKLEAFISRGVNRISIGLQTIHENERKILGRIHDFEDFNEAFQMAKECGISNIGVDLMYGIPEQTPESFEQTLLKVISLQPTHISAYGLILEEETPLWQQRDNLTFPGEDDECDMYELACSLLRKHGYNHYEISNYAKGGYKSRHNMKYWDMSEFIGVGASAYSYFEGKRFGNTSDIFEYLSEGFKQYMKEENQLDDLAFEFVMLGLRTSQGISLTEYENFFGQDFRTGRRDKINNYISLGYMTESPDRIALSEKGFYISNTILTDLL